MDLVHFLEFQVVATAQGIVVEVFALGDDGRIWRKKSDGSKWFPQHMDGVPGWEDIV